MIALERYEHGICCVESISIAFEYRISHMNCIQSTFLVVDDEPLVLKYIASILRRMGCNQVLEAENASLAAEVLQKNEISVLVSDITLPDGDGRILAANLLETNPTAVVVLITGFDASEVQISPGIRERVRLLQKPFTPDDVSELLGAELSVQPRVIA